MSGSKTGAAALSIVSNTTLILLKVVAGTIPGSVAIGADAANLRSDAFTSGGVLAALVLIGLTGQQWIDSVVALLVAAVITVAGVRILTRSSRVLVDEALPADELDAIRNAVMAF